MCPSIQQYHREPIINIDRQGNKFYRIWCNLREQKETYHPSVVEQVEDRFHRIKLRTGAPPNETLDKLKKVYINKYTSE